MIALNYSTYDVLVMFRQNGGSVNPTVDQIARFDADLFTENETTLLDIMTQEGLETRKDTKSTVLLYSYFGARSVPQRIRSACRYFKNTSKI
jgi:hypothetical protein